MTPEILYGIGALVLLAGLIWGVTRGRLKSPRARAISEEATRELYEEPERYDEARQNTLEEAAKTAEAEERKDNS